MIEKIIYDYLKKNLKVKVCLETPDPEPKEYVIFERTGGDKSNYLSNAVIAIQSLSTSLLKTIELNEKVKRSMENMDMLESICKVKLNSDYNFTDTNRKKYRYQAVFEIKYYEEENHG
ncbi:MAG: hypothetical protein RSA49_05215 [Anaerovoracaceae bacterium]